MVCKYKIQEKTVYKFLMPMITSNMYIIMEKKEALIIDPNENDEAAKLLTDNGIEKVTIILTHEHFDHISGVNFFRERWNCKVIGNRVCQTYVKEPAKNLSAFFTAMFITRSKEEIEQAQEIFSENYACEIGEAFEGEHSMSWCGLDIYMKDTPGHSMASICIIINERYIFTGDSLVQGAKIVTRLPGGDKKLYREITKPFLESLPKDMIVFPGHGEESLLRELEIS